MRNQVQMHTQHNTPYCIQPEHWTFEHMCKKKMLSMLVFDFPESSSLQVSASKVIDWTISTLSALVSTAHELSSQLLHNVACPFTRRLHRSQQRMCMHSLNHGVAWQFQRALDGSVRLSVSKIRFRSIEKVLYRPPAESPFSNWLDLCPF